MRYVCALDDCDQPCPGGARYCSVAHEDLMTREQRRARSAERARAYQRKVRAERVAAGLTTDGTPRARTRTLHDTDMVAVALVCEGTYVELNQGEKRMVVSILTSRGAPRAVIAERLRCSIPNVDRLRAIVRAGTTENQESAA